MLMTEWDWDDAKEVWQNEAKEEIVTNALAKGFPLETIHDVTGIDMETIQSFVSK